MPTSAAQTWTPSTSCGEAAAELADGVDPDVERSRQAQGSNWMLLAQYQALGGSNAHFDIPVGGQQDWSRWSPKLAATSGDPAATL